MKLLFLYQKWSYIIKFIRLNQVSSTKMGKSNRCWLGSGEWSLLVGANDQLEQEGLLGAGHVLSLDPGAGYTCVFSL